MSQSSRTRLRSSNGRGERNTGFEGDGVDASAAGVGAGPRESNGGEMQRDDEVELTENTEGTGCWSKFRSGIRGIWATSLTEDTGTNRELFIKTTLRELIIYIIFIIILMIVAFGMTSSYMFYYTKVLNDLFVQTKDKDITFATIGSISDTWTYLQGTLLNGLYWDTWYNQQNLSTEMHNFIFYENKLLGVPRIRQVRVRNDSCDIAPNFKGIINACYAVYSSSAEDKSPFGPANSSAWIYSTASQLGSRGVQGVLGSYSGGGYYVDLDVDKDVSAKTLQYLFDNLWIIRGTRMLAVDFTIYNANINLFSVIKLIVEFPATGGAFPTFEFRTVKLVRYVTPMDYFVLACECIFLCYLLYYIIEEVIEIKKHRLSYFKAFWNILDILVIVISLVCAGFNIYRTITVQGELNRLLANDTMFPDFDFISYWQLRFNHALAITVFFAWVKIFKYISFNKTMTQLSSTLGRSGKDLAGFAIMFFIIFFAFAQCGYLIFGSQVNDFREFEHSVFTLFRIILGDFDFYQLEAADRILGPAFFILYVFFVFFILINMFLAIINDSYIEVKTELAVQKNEFEMADYFKKRAEQVMSKMNLKRDRIVDIQKAIQAADYNNDRVLDFDEWRAELKTRGYADGEIEAVFAKYDVDGDRVLDEKEQKRMQAELEGQKAALTEELQNDNSDFNFKGDGGGGDGAEDQPGIPGAGFMTGTDFHEFHALERRVDRMEESVGLIVNKIDAVLEKMRTLEMAKVAHRQTMSKILDSISGTEDQPEEVRREQMEKMVREELHRLGTPDVQEPKPRNAMGGHRRVYED